MSAFHRQKPCRINGFRHVGEIACAGAICGRTGNWILLGSNKAERDRLAIACTADVTCLVWV